MIAQQEEMWQVHLVAGDAAVRVVVRGSLTADGAAVARESLLGAFGYGVGVVLDLTEVSDLAEDAGLSHLIDIAQRRSWSARCGLEVLATHPDIQRVLCAQGL